MGVAETVAEQNGADPDASESLLDGIRRRHRQLDQAPDRIKLNVPGYQGELVAVYKRAPWEQIGGIVTRLSAGVVDGDVALDDALDLMIRSCERIDIRVGEDYVPLHEADRAHFGGEPVTYDERLADACEVRREEITDGEGRVRARSVVVAVVGRNREALLASHGAYLASWYIDDTQKGDLDF